MSFVTIAGREDNYTLNGGRRRADMTKKPEEKPSLASLRELAAIEKLKHEQLPEQPLPPQEAMLKALANIRQFRAEARFSTWLIQITVNEALMRRRRERNAIMEGIDDHRDQEGEYTPRDFADWREIPSEALERKEVRQKLAHALAALDRKYREVFVLRDMEQLNIQETAEALGISIASVKTRLLRARLMLRDLLAAGWEQGWFSRLPFEKGTKPW